MALSFLADEDFDGNILNGLFRRAPGLDIVRVQDIGLAGALDPEILDWAAQEGRILLTHDVSSMPDHAYARVRAGLRLPGVCVVPQSLPVGRAIDDLLIVTLCSRPEDWEDQVRHLPL